VEPLKFLSVILLASTLSSFSVFAQSKICERLAPRTQAYSKSLAAFEKKVKTQDFDHLDIGEGRSGIASCFKDSEILLMQDYTVSYGKKFNQWSLLNEVFSLLPQVKTTVYRGTNALLKEFGFDGVIEPKLKKGQLVTLSRFVSTSVDRSVAEDLFTDGALLVVKAKSARDIQSFSQVPKEKEMILVKGTKLRVTSVRHKILPAIEIEGQMMPEQNIVVYELAEE
jgi:hypothetical protein